MLKINHYPGRTRLAAAMLAGTAILGPLTACSSSVRSEGRETAAPSDSASERTDVQCEARQVGQVVLSGETREAALQGSFPAEIDALDDQPFEIIIALVPEEATDKEYAEDSQIFEDVLNRIMPPPTVMATRYPIPEIESGSMNIVTLAVDPGCPLTAPSADPSRL